MLTDKVVASWSNKAIQLGERALQAWVHNKEKELLYLKELADIRARELEIREEEHRQNGEALLWRQQEHELYMSAERVAIDLAKSRLQEENPE